MLLLFANLMRASILRNVGHEIMFIILLLLELCFCYMKNKNNMIDTQKDSLLAELSQCIALKYIFTTLITSTGLKF